MALDSVITMAIVGVVLVVIGFVTFGFSLLVIWASDPWSASNKGAIGFVIGAAMMVVGVLLFWIAAILAGGQLLQRLLK